MRSAAKGFQVRCTSAEDDDVTSIRFSARKAKTAAARTVGRVQRKERVKQREGRGGAQTKTCQWVPATISRESYPRIRSQRSNSWSVDRYPEKALTIHLKAIRNLHTNNNNHEVNKVVHVRSSVHDVDTGCNFTLSPQGGTIAPVK